jgi:hypothetical protein
LIYGPDLLASITGWCNYNAGPPGFNAVGIDDIILEPGTCNVLIQGVGIVGYSRCSGTVTCSPFSLTITGCIDLDGFRHDITITP